MRRPKRKYNNDDSKNEFNFNNNNNININTINDDINDILRKPMGIPGVQIQFKNVSRISPVTLF